MYFDKDSFAIGISVFITQHQNIRETSKGTFYKIYILYFIVRE